MLATLSSEGVISEEVYEELVGEIDTALEADTEVSAENVSEVKS